AISSAPKPPSRIRNCVVKIKRLKIGECRISGELYHNNSVFEPARNSTMYAPKKRPAKPKHPPANAKVLSGKSKYSAADKDVAVKIVLIAGPKEISTRLKKVSPSKPVPEYSTTKKARFFHRDQPPTRSRSSVTRNVYDFLSQSQIEDDNTREDPAADIIQRLVENGKACVMIPLKAGGKLRAKIKKRRPVGRRKQCSLENLAGETAKTEAKKSRPLRQREVARALSPIYEPEDDSSNDAEEAYNEPIQVPVQVHAPPDPAVQSNASKQISDGAYSHLARSVLLNQTKAHDEQQASSRRRDLLNMARQLVSTPLNRKAVTVPEPNSTTHNISPIPRHPPNSAASPGGGASPWRVSDQSAMPNTFTFGFNTSNLPSYSSDHTTRPRHVYVPDTQGQEEAAPVNEKESFCNTLHDPSPSVNDSNEENRPPPTPSRTLLANELENAENANDADNFVHLPNPRKTLTKRRPFQDINILDVVVLPSWKKNVQVTPSKDTTSPKVDTATPTRQRSQTRANLFGFDEILPCEDQPTNATDQRASSSRNLFGFEDFLPENEVVTSAARSSTLSQNETLHDKLHRLGGLRPMDIELAHASSNSLRQDCFGEVPLCQRDIRQVMCSTMIAPKEPPRRKPALAADETIGLFRDEAELETTFDNKKPRRTYVKERPKRKRKQRVHVLYIDTDSSEDENEQDLLDNSVDSPQKKQQLKRPRKDVEHEAKLQEFITSFNRECEEVEKFSLIIE
ncbi:hypothetical protein KR200_005855, partial [Drosophila serrata]